MSLEAMAASLLSPIKELVLDSKENIGKTDTDKAEVSDWLEKVSKGNIVKDDNLKVHIQTSV